MTTNDATISQPALLAELNDLLQLDHDAIGAYSIAIARLRNDGLRQTLREFKRDHERHVESLTRVIGEQGGVAIQLPHLPSGVFKLAIQGLGALGGDAELLLAFKANERQSRDKYRRAAQREFPLAVRDVKSLKGYSVHQLETDVQMVLWPALWKVRNEITTKAGTSPP